MGHGRASPETRRGLQARAERPRRQPLARAWRPWGALLASAQRRGGGLRRCATAPLHGGVRLADPRVCWRLLPPQPWPPGWEPSRTHGTYQRDRLVSRRGARGFASLTVRVRPASSLPWSPAMALFAVVLSGISTKPKPLERPVSRSIMTRISSTTPYGSKSWRRSSSVVVNARLPT